MTRARASFIIGLLVLSTVSWRHGAYYTGGFDSVVIAKALLGCLALTVATLKRSRCYRPGASLYVYLVLYLAISLIGASQTESLLASFVLSARVVLIALTVQIVWASVGTAVLMNIVSRLSVALVFIAAGTGLPAWSPVNRLTGGLPPITANELAFFSAIGVIYLFWSIMTNGMRTMPGAGLILLLVIIWLTESRTSLACAVLSMIFIAVLSKRPSPVVVSIGCFAAPVVFYAVAFTNLLSTYIQRGGVENIGTFNNRTLAWDSALNNASDLWFAFFGQGLSTKEVQVAAKYWDTQPLDSSWASALVQSGWLGAIVLTIWIFAVAITLMTRKDLAMRSLCAGFFLFLVSRSVLESGLFDATGAFLIFYIVSLFSNERQPPRSPSLPIAITERFEPALSRHSFASRVEVANNERGGLE